ncbi:hypothetical protein QR680_016161 [Steinernema hermaphroditum]|uniref:Uncharacterized protein n=1 Tax=Steinernema hermaphroditum TaxID=289476 RepID=A0AA39HAA2_9BILA|nr:hypothetical protein QR680_016161 [Steinernema hermaphroditum]
MPQENMLKSLKELGKRHQDEEAPSTSSATAKKPRLSVTTKFLKLMSCTDPPSQTRFDREREIAIHRRRLENSETKVTTLAQVLVSIRLENAKLEETYRHLKAVNDGLKERHAALERQRAVKLRELTKKPTPAHSAYNGPSTSS